MSSPAAKENSTDKLLAKIHRGNGRTSTIMLPKITLKKELTLLNSITFVLGGIIGSGIFVTPSTVLELTGSFGLSLVAWAVGGLIAICGGLSYCELGTLVGSSGGEYAYLLEAYSFKKRNSTLATFGEVVAFLYLWTSLVTGPASMAIITLAFGSYLSQALAGGNDPPTLSLKLLALAALGKKIWHNIYIVYLFVSTSIARWTITNYYSISPIAYISMVCVIFICIVVVAVVNSYSLKLTAYVINILSLAKSLALLLIVVLGVWQLTTAGELEYELVYNLCLSFCI